MFVSKKQFKGTGCSFTPSFKGSPSLFVSVELSPFAFHFFAFLLVADLYFTLSDDSCIAVSLSLTLAHVSSFPWTAVQPFLRSVPVLPCVSSCLHSHWRMVLTLDPAYWMPWLVSSYGPILFCPLYIAALYRFVGLMPYVFSYPIQK